MGITIFKVGRLYGLQNKMQKVGILTLFATTLILAISGGILSGQEAFRYPCYLLEAYNPDDDCWKGVNANGDWPVPVIPEDMLVGPPPSDVSGVTVPIDHWVELQFRGRIIDGPGDDIFLIELGQMGEQALVFITDGSKGEYLLGLATAFNTGLDTPTDISFDISGILPPFVPHTVRLVALDIGGCSPGFDIANIRARTYIDHGSTAYNPVPIDGAKNVSTDTVLSWSPGDSADKHVVYFSTAPTDVDANANPVSNPAQPQDVNSFDPGGLELGRTYYWRVDEVNSTDVNNPVTGEIWSFTVADYLVIDDFESYNNSDKQIYMIWEETGGAYVNTSTYPIRQCIQSMSFDYYNRNYYYSEATRKFDPPQDWASAAGKILELFFHGGISNDTNTQMYLLLNDGNDSEFIPYNDMNDIKQPSWQPWRIILQDLTSLNLSHIQNISIGFRSQPSQISRGIVYFDDIRLYPSRCLEENRPYADLDGDCAVNFEDLREIAYNWLDKSPKTYPVAPPNEPLVWYRFDGDTNNSINNSYHGQKVGSPTYVPGIYGQAIRFDGYRDSVKIANADELFQKISTGITITFWQYGLDSAHRNDTLCCSNYKYGVDNPAIAINLGCWTRPRRAGLYNWDCGYPWSFNSRLSGDHKYKSEWSGRWNHWAFIKDTKKDIMQIFFNGSLYDSRTDANSPIAGITSFEIGSGWYGGYDGLIDDFYIYDYALTEAEIAYTATNGTGIFVQPLLSSADLNGDNLINFNDFAILAGSWLNEHLWP